MYPRFAFALLFSICAFGLGIAIPAFPVEESQCGPNAEYLTCGSACVPDCANPESPKMCTLQCVGGCFCKAGFLKNAKGQCVLPELCQVHDIPMQIPAALPKCPDNEEFHPCGTACPATCANPHPSPVCTRNCVIGCFCKAGYLRNAVGVCVPADKCEAPKTNMLFAYPPEVSQCKENEIFMPCGSACAPTCANPHPSPVCTRQCVIGCFCKPGFLKNEQGVCVPSERCGVPAADAVPLVPAICSENEEYRQCKGCDGTCKNPNPICPRICVPGCACKHGHVRDGNGKCMLLEQCPKVNAMEFMMLPPMPKCGEHETYVNDPSGAKMDCMASCDVVPYMVHGVPHVPKKCMEVTPKPTCVCSFPYVRNHEGRCVERKECSKVNAMESMMMPPMPKCGENEVFHSCGTACPATCANPHPSPVCTKNCVIGCFCKEGFLKNANGVCVAAANCEGPIAFAANPLPRTDMPYVDDIKCPGEHETYIEGPSGAMLDCMASCDVVPYLIHGAPHVPKKCLEVTPKPTCVCSFPYVRNHEGRCVERKECPKHQ